MIKNLLKTSFPRFALLLVLATGIVYSCDVGDTSDNPDTRLTLNPDRFILSSDGSIFAYNGSQSVPTFSITANLGYTATTDAGWLSVDPVEGTGVTTVTIIAEENTSGQRRTGTITLTSNGKALKVTVIQLED